MADANITIATEDAWAPEIWETTATFGFNSVAVARALCSNDYQAGIGPGDKVNVPHVFTQSALTLTNATGTMTRANSTDVVNSITLSDPIYVHQVIDFAAELITSVPIAANYGKQIGEALALQFDDDMMDAMDGATTAGTDNVDITDSVILTAQKTLNDNKTPQNGRWLLVSTGTVQAFRNEEKYQNSLYSASSGGQKGVLSENGYVGRIYEFEVYMTQQALSGSSGKKSFMGQMKGVQYVIKKDITMEPPRVPYNELSTALTMWMWYGDKLMDYKATANGSSVYSVVELGGT
jgi:hypothetical protein